jgi:hypothetical protein
MSEPLAGLTSSELATWRALIGTARQALERPSANADRMFRRAGEAAFKTVLPARDDPIAMRLFFSLTTLGREWYAMSHIERDVALERLRTTLEACAEILGPAPAPVDGDPERPPPWWVQERGA